jgi:hypothetical protein
MPRVTSLNSIENDNTVTLIQQALENIYPTPRIRAAVTFIEVPEESIEEDSDRRFLLVNR